jgi:hypothetical protein
MCLNFWIAEATSNKADIQHMFLVSHNKPWNIKSSRSSSEVQETAHDKDLTAQLQQNSNLSACSSDLETK